MTDSWNRSRHRTETVPLVEADEGWVPVLERGLAEVGLPGFERVGNGEAAIAYLDGQGPFTDRTRFPVPRLILTSICLPKVSGLEALGWLKSRSDLRHIPVIVFAESEGPRHVSRACEAGANSYLMKPHGDRELTETPHAFRTFWTGFPWLSRN